MREFSNDLRQALGVWRRSPALPTTSLALGLVYLVPEPYALGMFPLILFGIGWVGTERIWYLRSFRGRSISFGEIWRFTWGFLGRFVALGVLVLLVYVPLFLAFAPTGNLSLLLAIATILTIPVDVALTFVTPALTYSTRRATTAIGLGLQTLRDEWPRCAVYALVPPLAFIVASLLSPTQAVVQALLSGAAMLFNLWVKGATAAFYLRRHDTGDDGSAFIPRGQETWDQPREDWRNPLG